MEPSLEAVLGESHFYADYCFAYGADEPRWPAFVSTVRVRRAGFGACYDTEESFRHWLRTLVARKVLPGPG